MEVLEEDLSYRGVAGLVTVAEVDLRDHTHTHTYIHKHTHLNYLFKKTTYLLS